MTPNPQYVILFHHFRRLLEVFAKEGIDAAPLKGAHLLTSVYPEGEERGTLSDVDFLVREGDWKRALEAMEREGFTRREHFANEERLQEVGFHLDLAPGRHVLFEIHRHLFSAHRISIDHDAIWARSTPSTFDGAPCRRLAAEDHFCHIALHALIHRLDPPVTSLRDLELLLASEPDLAPRAAERARQWRITRIAWLYLRLLEERTADPSLGRIAAGIAPPRPVRALARAIVPDGDGTRLSFLNHRVQAALLWPVLFDSPLMTARFAANHPLVQKILGRA